MASTGSQSKDITVRVTASGYKGWERKAQWSATVGGLTGYGATATAAAEDAAAQLTRLAEIVHVEPVVVMLGGYVSVAMPSVDGWTTRTYRPDGVSSMSGGCSGESRKQVEASIRYSLAQRVTDWFDDESVRSGAAFCLPDSAHERQIYGPTEFMRYAAWQRAAKSALDSGRQDWHEWASAHASEFAIAA